MNARREVIFLLIGALIFFLPFLSATGGKMPRLDTDYDSALPIYRYIVETFQETHAIARWNPFVSGGIPVTSDPLLSILNPFFILPLLTFGVENGIYVVFFLVLVSSAIGIWLFLKSLAISPQLRLLGSLLYAFSGALAARVAAGHIEKILSYPLLPIFFSSLLLSSTVVSSVIIALVWTLFLFSGDVYSLWLTLIIFSIINIFRVKRSILTFILFIVFSSIKLVPMITQVYPNLARLFLIDPFAGSIHVIYFFLPFIVPFQTSFYDGPMFQRLLGFHFNWYEYFAFISPLPFLFLLRLSKIWKKREVKYLLLILIIGAFYVSLRYPYSPFYWLFHILPQVDIFRVPQRMFMVMTPVMVALLVLCAEKWSRKFSYIVLSLAIIWSFGVSLRIWARSFEPKRLYAESIAQELRSRDQSGFYVASFVCCLQWYLVGERIPIINYYYGWKPKKAPNFINDKGDEYDFSALKMARPKYILGYSGMDFSTYSYEVFFEEKPITIWKTVL